MSSWLASIDNFLTALSRDQILAVAFCCVALIAFADHLTGYEASASIFYLLPVAMAAWYAGKGASISIAVLSCVSWALADITAGHSYHHTLLAVWNALVRLGFFLVNGLLVAALRQSLLLQRQLARTDALTGAFGRRAFDERLEHDLDAARRKQSSLTLVFLDLDNFKGLNDTRGHHVGDESLRKTALALKEAARRTDTVARLGGDEFALVLPDTGIAGAEELVTRVRGNLQQALSAVSPTLTCSIGVVTFEEAPPSVDEAIRAADALMYEAKRRGKNSAVFSVVASATQQAARASASSDAPLVAPPSPDAPA